MRIIKERTLSDLIEENKYKAASGALSAWVFEVKRNNWKNANELKSNSKSASIISSKRVVFNIKGNDFRLIVDIEYRAKIVFIVWFGTLKEYDKINAKLVSYEK